VDAEQETRGRGRAGIIHAVQSPLGFFTLAVLIVEVVLGVLASRATGWDYSVLLGGMIIFMFALVAFVGTIVVRHPELLLGVEAAAAHRHAVLSEQLQRVNDEARALRQATESAQALASHREEENTELRKLNSQLTARLARLDSLTNGLWAVLHHSHSVALTVIYKELGAEADQSIRNEILSVLGTLIDEKRVERDPMNPGYYRAVKP